MGTGVIVAGSGERGRVLLVDDSRSARALVAARLRAHGWSVDEAHDATEGAEHAIASPPAAIITDLWMPGLSGLQLCRVMRAATATHAVPIVLLTANDDRRSRFWARRAGASAYVTKNDLDGLVAALTTLTRDTAQRTAIDGPPALHGARSSIAERLSQLLDQALFESVIAAEVRALALNGDVDRLFAGLAAMLSDVLAYRWMALRPLPSSRVLLHTGVGSDALIDARTAFGLPSRVTERRAHTLARDVVMRDERVSSVGHAGPPLVVPIAFGGALVATIALCSSAGAATREVHELVTILEAELGGPLRMVSLAAEAQRLAGTDALTGLRNRRAFHEAIAALPPDVPHSLMLLDVDHFKTVNDTHGHDAGDAVLCALAKVVERVVRESDVVARWGGEEIIVLLAGTRDAGARVAGERMRRAIEETRVTLPSGEPLAVTASIGVATATDGAFVLDALVTRADAAMYAAKRRGRNRVEAG